MNAAQLAIDMARGQEQRIDARNEDKAATVQAGQADTLTLDLRRSLNGLKVGLSLVTACIWKGEDAEKNLKELIDLTQSLSNELLPDTKNNEEEKRQAAIIRTSILRCVEEVAKQDTADSLSSAQLASLFDIASELSTYETLPPQNIAQSFDLSFLVAIGFNTSSLTETFFRRKSNRR